MIRQRRLSAEGTDPTRDPLKAGEGGILGNQIKQFRWLILPLAFSIVFFLLFFLETGYSTVSQDEAPMNIVASQDDAPMYVVASQDEAPMYVVASQDEAPMEVVASQDNAPVNVVASQDNVPVDVVASHDNVSEVFISQDNAPVDAAISKEKIPNDVLRRVSLPHVPTNLPPPMGLSANFDMEAELQASKMECSIGESLESLLSKHESPHLVKETPGFFGPVEGDRDPMFRQGVRVVALPDFDYTLVPMRATQSTVHRGGVSLFPSALIYNHAVFSCGTEFYQMQCHNEYHRTAINASDATKSNVVSITISDPVVFIAQIWGTSFYHFFIEDFMRLALVYEYLLANEHVKIISYEIDGADMTPFFSLIGINPSRLIKFSRSTLYHANSGVIVPSGTSCLRGQSRALHKLRAIMKPNLLKKFPNDTKYDIVLEQRSTSNGRYFGNHDELEAALKKAFPQYSIGVCPPADAITTARMHLNAKLIIGPHGAGGSNILFAEDDANLIEVHPLAVLPDLEKPSHYSTCNEWTTHQLHGRSVVIIVDHGHHWKGGPALTAPIDDIIGYARDLLPSA